MSFGGGATRYKIAVCEELGDWCAPAFEGMDLKAKDVQTALVRRLSISLTCTGSSIALAISGWSS
jgi:hypothetical protein